MTQPELVTQGEVRRALLAVCVLDEVDLQPTDAGVLLPGHAGGPAVLLPWEAAVAVLGDHRADSPAARPRLRSWLSLHRAVADLGAGAGEALAVATRPLALDPRGALHPGPSWARGHVLGGTLDVGLGVVDLLAAEPSAVPLWPDVAAAAGVLGASADVEWSRARAHLEVMGELAVLRLARDQRAASRAVRVGAGPGGWARGWADALPGATVLRPVGGCDVPTLLASAALRTWLAAQDGTGMRAVAVPTRTRGWFDLARVDPAFVGAAWSATDADQRGLPRAVLVTADEVVLARGT